MTDSPQDGAGNGPGSPVDGLNPHSGSPDNPPPISGPEIADSGDQGKDPDSFPRAYVEDLRKESAGYRTKAQRADALAQRLVYSMASTTGRMADPTDLPYSDGLLGDDGFPDSQKVNDAIDDLLKRKPHLMSRKPTATVDQGASDSGKAPGLMDSLRASNVIQKA